MAIAPTPFDLGQGANVNLLMQPFQQGLQSYRQGMDKQFEGERALKKEQLAERALDLDRRGLRFEGSARSKMMDLDGED